MLLELTIENLAIAKNVSLEFKENLNILTGETGAGKSIIVKALSALLGGKLTADSIREGENSLKIEGVFTLDKNFSLRTELGDLTNEEDNIIVLSREVDIKGRHKYRVNQKMVPISILRLIGEHLVDIHGQHEPQSLLNKDVHINLLDSFFKDEILSLRSSFLSVYRQLKEAKAELKKITEFKTEKQKEIDLLKYQDEELTLANLKENEDIELEQEFNILSNIKTLQDLILYSYNLVKGEYQEEGVLKNLQEILKSLSQGVKIDPKISYFVDEINGSFETLKDLSSELRSYLDSLVLNDERLSEVTKRRDFLISLKEKYKKSIHELIEYYAKIKIELNETINVDSKIENLKEKIKIFEEQLSKLVLELSKKRKEGATVLSSLVETELKDLAMKEAKFLISVENSLDPEGLLVENERFKVFENGIDTVEFLIAPNPGEGLKPLKEIASGGEISRVMLALKKVFADVDDIEILVFDEVDSGIGGQTGEMVGRKLYEISKNHQVIVITHLPPIASFPSAHFYIEKKIKDERTQILVKELLDDERIYEIARLMSGEISNINLEHARELIENKKIKTK